MSSTTSNYVSKIKQDYPVAGQDNDSQGFRDNFKNIALAISSADTDITSLKLNSVSLDNSNDFGDNLIKQAVFQDCSVYVFDDTATAKSGDFSVDYRDGSYQKFKLTEGSHTISVTNWPGDNKSATLVLDLSTSTIYQTYVDFSSINVVNLSSENLPALMVGDVPYLFEIRSNGSAGDLFVKKLNERILEATTIDVNSVNVTGTYITAVESLKIGGNTYQVDATNSSTLVTAPGSVGKIALLPQAIDTTITGSIGDLLATQTTTTFDVASSEGIYLGATFQFTGTYTTYTVEAIDNTKITTQEFRVDSGWVSENDDITFFNPTFTDQPTLVTLIDTEPASTTAVKGDLKGRIYANSTTLFVSYDDYSPNATNWFKIQTSAGGGTASVSENSTALATTEFVHNLLPYGSIIMWYGNIASIPTGWALCDGTNSTPDLRDKFVIGASQDGSGTAKTNVTGSLTATGGSKDATVVSHTHDITDPGHTHDYDRLPLTGNVSMDDIFTSYGTYTPTATSSTTTGITVNSTGTSGTNMNLPPYYALAYIMKTSGA